MQTVLKTIERAYSKIQVKQAGVDLTAQEIEDAISELNEMMWVHTASGMALAWEDVTSSSQTLPLPDYAIAFATNGLALRLGAEFGVMIPQALPAMYEEALRVVELNTVRTPDIPFPDTLPRGGGASSIYSTSRYFTDDLRGALQGGTAGFLRTDEDTVINAPSENSGDTP